MWSWGARPDDGSSTVSTLAGEDLDRVAAAPARRARLSPIRNWPDRLRLSGRNGEDASFAVADPNAVLAWFRPSERPHPGGDPPPAWIASQGVY